MSSESSKRAWETRRKNNKTPGSVCKTKTFNSPAKNEFRKKVVEAFMGENETILTLESPEMLFVDALPTQKFIIVEKDKQSYKKIVEANRKNVIDVYHGDVSMARYMDGTFKYAFLDFCGGFETSHPIIISMLNTLNKCDKIALTYCLRGNKKEVEDSKFNIANQILNTFQDFKIDHAETYADGAPMVGAILSKKGNGKTERTNKQFPNPRKVKIELIKHLDPIEQIVANQFIQQGRWVLID